MNTNLLQDVPDELFIEYMMNLSFDEIQTVCRTNQRANKLVYQSNNFWRQYSARRYQQSEDIKYVNNIFTQQEPTSMEQLRMKIYNLAKRGHLGLAVGICYFYQDEILYALRG